MIEYKSKSELVIEYLEEMISNGKLKPGDRMTATEVADLLHVSRTPVNEALKRLSDRGIVKILPNVGFEVIILLWNEIEDSIRIKMILEKTVIKWIRDRNIEVKLEPIMTIAKQVSKAIEMKDFSTYSTHMKNFHFAFISLANSKPLLTSYSLAWAYRDFEEPSFHEFASELQELVNHHISIINCIKTRDFDNALEISQRHEDRWIEIYKQYHAKMSYQDSLIRQ